MTPTLEAFESNPTHKDAGHSLYRACFFALQTMPENATSDALLGSLHRRLGLAVVNEGEVAGCGSEFLRRVETLRASPAGAKLTPLLLRSVLLTHLDSPASQSQAKARSLTLIPLVPELANYTAAVRLRGSPWNPGRLAAEALWLGSRSADEAAASWSDLYAALRVGPSDDAWARFINAEVKAWRIPRVAERARAAGADEPSPLASPSAGGPAPLGADEVLQPPARQLAADLRKVIALRPRLTRREWLAHLEALLRLGLVTHTQWLCLVHSVLWQEVESALLGQWRPEGLEDRIRRSLGKPLWNVGDLYSGRSTGLARAYLRARYGLNLVLFALDPEGSDAAGTLVPPTNFAELVAFTSELCQRCSLRSDRLEIGDRLTNLLERTPQVANCRSGLTNNLREFWLYALAKRQVRLRADSEFDQGAWCQKRGGATGAPWIVQPGPLALGLAAHCCSMERGIGATVKDFQAYLLRYGIGTRQADFSEGPFADRMRGLGIVVDSPDAESGMGIIDPLGMA